MILINVSILNREQSNWSVQLLPIAKVSTCMVLGAVVAAALELYLETLIAASTVYNLQQVSAPYFNLNGRKYC